MTGVTQAVFMNQRSFGSGWIATLNGSITSLYGEGIAVDSSGNVYVVGYNTTTLPYFEIVKYNNLGQIQWQVQLGYSSGEQKGYSIAVDSSGNVYIVGYQYTGSPSFLYYLQLAKYNTSGVLQWQRNLGTTGGATTLGEGIAVDSSGNVYVVGYHRVNTYSNYFIQLAKYNTSGTLQWQRNLGNPAYTSVGNGIAVDSSSNVYVVGGSDNGFQLVKYDTSGVIQWQRSIYGQPAVGVGISLDSSNNIYIVGHTYSAPVDLQLVKCDANGITLWQRTLSSASSDLGNGIAVDSTGNAYVVGSTFVSGFYDLQLAKYNTNGDIQWQCGLGNTGTSTEGKSIAIAPNGNVCVTGSSNASGSYSRSIIASLPNDGAKTGTYNVGGYNYTYYPSALIDAPGSFTNTSSSLTDAVSSLTSAASSLLASNTSWTSNTTSI